MRPIPPGLCGRPFTIAEARAAGITARMLQGRRFVEMTPGVYRTATTPETFPLSIAAALRVLPDDAVVSHVTNLRLRGFEVGPLRPLHFSTCSPHPVRRDGITVHRRQQRIQPVALEGFAATGPRRTFVDCATQLDDRRLLRVGDWLVGTAQVALDELRRYVGESHLDGVVRARRTAALVRAGVASPRESDLRWTLHRAGLPEPEVNVDVHDDHGAWLARGDLVYRQQKVLVEYDGWQHERDATQRQWDHLRREQLEAAGWRVIVVTAADFADPRAVTARVRQALRSRSVRVATESSRRFG